MTIRFTKDYSEIPASRRRDSCRLTPEFTRVRHAAAGEQPPEIGQVSELIRNTLTKEYGIYPPNLSTAIQGDQNIVITAVNPQTGLNLQVTLKNLAGNLITPNGITPGVIPPEGAGGGAPAVPPAAPAMPPAPVGTAPGGAPGAVPGAF